MKAMAEIKARWCDTGLLQQEGAAMKPLMQIYLYEKESHGCRKACFAVGRLLGFIWSKYERKSRNFLSETCK